MKKPNVMAGLKWPPLTCPKHHTIVAIMKPNAREIWCKNKPIKCRFHISDIQYRQECKISIKHCNCKFNKTAQMSMKIFPLPRTNRLIEEPAWFRNHRTVQAIAAVALITAISCSLSIVLAVQILCRFYTLGVNLGPYFFAFYGSSQVS
jgi:hypothetical protein